MARSLLAQLIDQCKNLPTNLRTVYQSWSDKLLDCKEVKEEIIVDEVKKWDHKGYFFRTKNSIPVPTSPPEITLPSSKLPIIPYRSLKPCHSSTSGTQHNVVKYKNVRYVLKSANLPGDVPSLAQELRNYQLVKGSKWAAELGGIIRRQARKEGIQIRYYSAGDLRLQHFGADIKQKRQWVIQIATALDEFEKCGYFQQDLKCERFRRNRMIDLENCWRDEGLGTSRESDWEYFAGEFL